MMKERRREKEEEKKQDETCTLGVGDPEGEERFLYLGKPPH